VQALFTQVWFAAHIVPQAPQLSGSVLVLVQAPPQSSKPPGQSHIEALQIWPCGHFVVQSPQCAGLFSVLTQRAGIPQAVLFDGHTHTLPSQM